MILAWLLALTPAAAETDEAPCDHARVVVAAAFTEDLPTSSKIAIWSWDEVYATPCSLRVDITPELRASGGEPILLRNEEARGLLLLAHDGLAPETTYALTLNPHDPDQRIEFTTGSVPKGDPPGAVQGQVVSARRDGTRTRVTFRPVGGADWWVLRADGNLLVDYLPPLREVTLTLPSAAEGGTLCFDLRWVGLDGTEGPVRSECVVPTEVVDPIDEDEPDSARGGCSTMAGLGLSAPLALILMVLVRRSRR